MGKTDHNQSIPRRVTVEKFPAFNRFNFHAPCRLGLDLVQSGATCLGALKENSTATPLSNATGFGIHVPHYHISIPAFSNDLLFLGSSRPGSVVTPATLSSTVSQGLIQQSETLLTSTFPRNCRFSYSWKLHWPSQRISGYRLSWRVWWSRLSRHCPESSAFTQCNALLCRKRTEALFDFR